MPRYPDKIDLYDDRGNLVDTNVPLEAISPLLNPAIKQMVQLIKRCVVVDLEGLEKALATGAVGGARCIVAGRSLKLDLVANAEAIADKLAECIRVKPDDDTEVKVIRGGKTLLVYVPSTRFEAGVEYTTGCTTVAAGLCYTIIEMFNVDLFDADLIHTAVWGRHPQTVDMLGGFVKMLLAMPQANEGPGYALRNVPVAHLAIITRKNAMNAAALASILEHTAAFEMGDAIGPFERLHLLGLAYQGLNANNMVYDLVKENGNGTLGDVVRSTVRRAVEDGVIRPLKKLTSGYTVYTTDDLPLWNAYAAAGLMAGTMVVCGAARAMQHIPSVMIYFNDLIERETGLPGVDFGRVAGTGVEMSFFSHSIYGGGNPVVFHGNHIVTRHSKGFVIPCAAAAVALDAGTVGFTPERVSGVVGEALGEVPLLREPLKHVAQAASQIKGEI